jgi:RNA polymerase sigma-70 factor, ECF subfamily
VSSYSAALLRSLSFVKNKPGNAVALEDRPLGSVEFSDEQLLSLVAEADREALALLFRRYARLVRSIGRRILRDDAEADDLVQEVFLYVYKKCSSYDRSRSSARSWLVQTSYYLALHQRMDRAARHPDHFFETDGIRASELASSSPPEYDRSVQGVFGREGWRELLAALTLDQWETLRLHFFEGYTLIEIGEKRGQPIGNVRHHYYRGLERLRRHLADREPSSGITARTGSRKNLNAKEKQV